MSNQRDREKRRQERLADEEREVGDARRRRMLRLSAAGVGLAVVIVLVVIVAVGSGGGSTADAADLAERPHVEELLTGIPQSATMLGRKDAPVRLYEYGDLQCTVCGAYGREILPAVIEGPVRKGEASITFRNFTIIGPDSVPAGEAALAAAAQGKGWNFIETWFHNQGGENSGYVTDEFIEAMARYVGVPNLGRWRREWKAGTYRDQLKRTTGQAERFGFDGTPSFAIEGPRSDGLELLGTPGSTGAIEEAIEKAS
jgi:protein-disulfide isomerase